MTTFWRGPWFAVAIALALTFGIAFAHGQDANWDLLNYHLYTPLAWLDGRLDQDIAAAQLQTWHNPVLDVPLAWMVRTGASGWVTTAWLTVPAFVALFIALRLLDALWPAHRSLLRTMLAGTVAAFGTSAWWGTGTSFNDAYVAAGTVTALWWAVDSQRRQRGAWAAWLPVGLLAGVTAALKLTAAMYCIGFAAAAIAAGPARALPARMAALAAGGMTAFLLVWGPWGWTLWERFGNPFFPYFNNWFHSPDAMLLAHKDGRFLPETLADALQAPFSLLHATQKFSELEMRDPRLLLGLIALAVWGALALKRPRMSGLATGDSGRAADAAASGRSCALVLAFLFASYALWLAMYGIYRYLYPLELVFSIAIIGMLSQLPSRPWRIAAMMVVAFAMHRYTRSPDWGHQPFRTPMVSVRFPELPPNTLMLISSWEPIGHAAAFLPREIPVVSLYNNFMDPERCTGLQAKAEQRIAEHSGPLYLMRTNADDPGSAKIHVYGLAVEGACAPVDDSLTPMEVCRLSRQPAAVNPICQWPPAGR